MLLTEPKQRQMPQDQASRTTVTSYSNYAKTGNVLIENKTQRPHYSKHFFKCQNCNQSKKMHSLHIAGRNMKTEMGFSHCNSESATDVQWHDSSTEMFHSIHLL